MGNLYDVAVSFVNDSLKFEYIDTFVYENRLYAFMCMVGTTNAAIFEELELNGRNIGKGLGDTCYVPVYDPVIQAMAAERNMKGEGASAKGNQVMFTGLRTLDEYEKDLGHAIAMENLYYHDKAEL
jgi:hypothetical protein